MDYKVYKTDNDDLNPALFMEYNAETPKTGADLNGADADKAYHTYHLPVPAGGDPRHFSPEKLQSAEHEGVEYKADNEGQGDISLVFDGADDIATVVSAWNTANSGNEVSHDGTGTDVPTAITLMLLGDGIYHLTRDAQAVTDTEDVDKGAAELALYNTMVADVYTEMASVFGTKDPNSANAYYETYKLMIAAPANYAGQGLTVSVPSATFAAGDTLETDVRVTNYATERQTVIEAYSVWRMNRIETFKVDKAAL